MKEKAAQSIENSRTWLSQYVFPLWIKNGIKEADGSFEESLDEKGLTTNSVRRTMVQTRQIYSFSEGLKMQVLDSDAAKRIVTRSTDFLISKFSLGSGAFVHSIDSSDNQKDMQSELYTQAFVIFGLARAFEVTRNENYKATAKKVVQYLKSERLHDNGGFTETKEGQSPFQSNPHMHLFEAVLEWIKLDSDPVWNELAFKIYNLCIHHFIDAKVGCVCEFFDEKWTPLLEDKKFLFEPGHQYEWAWLLNEYQIITGTGVGRIPFQLFELAEKTGFVKGSIFAIDQVWSDLTPKKTTSRFWPHCERVKAAVALGLKAEANEQARFAKSADEAMEALTTYLDTPVKGLWFDSRSESGTFDKQPIKASSLYHIINALSEYARKRPLLKD